MTAIANASHHKKLAKFLRFAAGKKFVTWEFDCCYWLADWVVAATGKPDPAAHVRVVHPDIGPLGIARIVQRVADGCGLSRTTKPEQGDIAILRNKPGNDVVGAIKTRKGWAVLAKGRGLTIIRSEVAPMVRVMAAWKVDG